MTSKSIIITDKVPRFFIEELEKNHIKVEYRPNITQNELSKAIKDYTYLLVRGSIEVNEHVLDNAEQLQAVLRPGSGMDNIDRDRAEKKGIRLINSPEGNRDAVGDHAVGLLLSLLRNIPVSQTDTLKPAWNRYQFSGEEISEQTIAIIGYGNTGRAFAKRLSVFSCRVLAYDRYLSDYSDDYVEASSLKQIYEEATVVSLHVPLKNDTYYYIGDEFLSEMRHPFYVLNTSRGEVVKMEALIEGLRSGYIKGAGIDVLPGERDKKLLESNIEKLKPWIEEGKIVLTPHTAGLTSRSQVQIFNILIDKLLTEKSSES